MFRLSLYSLSRCIDQGFVQERPSSQGGIAGLPDLQFRGWKPEKFKNVVRQEKNVSYASARCLDARYYCSFWNRLISENSNGLKLTRIAQ